MRQTELSHQVLQQKQQSFNWTDEQEALVENNAPEPEHTPYPDIPAEMPGMVLEANIPTLETLPPPSEEEHMAVAIDNAGFAEEFEEFRYRPGCNKQHQMPNVNITHNHMNLIPTAEDKINEGQESEEDVADEINPPSIMEDKDSEDDETYIDEELEDVDLLYDDSKEDEPSTEAEQVMVTCSVRQVRAPERYPDTVHMTVGGPHFMVGQMHFTIRATDLVMPFWCNMMSWECWVSS